MSLDECSTFEYGEEDFIQHSAPWVDKDAPQLSKFDIELQQRWDHAMANGAFRYDISDMQTRILPGPSGYVAQLNTLRAVARRAPQKIVSVKQPFNPKEFNFNKVKPVEVIFDLSNKSSQHKRAAPKKERFIHKESNGADSNNYISQNGSANNNSSDNLVFENGFAKSDNGAGYTNGSCHMNGVNSNDGPNYFSSCNGCHAPSDNKPDKQEKREDNNDTQIDSKKDVSHLIVINVSPMEYGHCLLVPNRKLCSPQVMTEESYIVAIETMLLSRHRGLRMGFNSLCAFASVNHLHFHMFYLDYELISDYCHVSHLAGMYHEYTALPCPGFALQLHGSTLEQLAKQAYRISNYLYENDIAHNMFMCRGVVFGEERNSKLTTIRLFIWPRRKFIGNKSSEEFNVACIELVGHLPIKIEDGFHNLTEPDVNAILADACLPQSEYEAIKAKVVEMGKEYIPTAKND